MPREILTLSDANRALFQRYGDIIHQARSLPDAHAQSSRLSLDNLAWMCREASIENAGLPDDKASRWLGFVQGCLAMRGLIDVDEERTFTRPLFHAAAQARGEKPGPTKARAS